MKYNVGDKVVITERKHGHQFSIGETVKIVTKTDYDYYAKNENGASWWIIDDEIEYPSYKFNSKDEIHITTKGRHTYAVKKQNGKIVARSEAKCHKDDKFDFNTGVNLCLERLGIKGCVLTTEKFKVGDIVTTNYYSELGECVVLKVEDDNTIWITPLGHDGYTKRIAKNYMIKGFIKHETAFRVNVDWNTVVKVG